MTRQTADRQNEPSWDGQLVGHVAELWRYPVKSMAGEMVLGVEIGWHGMAGDRRWGFVREDVVRSGFPWLTIRQRPEMVHYRPRLVDPERPDRSAVTVRTPSGRDLDIADPQLAEELGASHVMKQDRGVFDAAPVSLLTAQSVESLSAHVGKSLDVRRFRPTLVVEAIGGGPFPEDAWVGAVLRIGPATMRVDRRDARCAVVNVDPESGQADPAALRAVAQRRESCLGVYGATVHPGRVSVGDPVVLLGTGTGPEPNDPGRQPADR